jgi:hypothetical protein
MGDLRESDGRVERLKYSHLYGADGKERLRCSNSLTTFDRLLSSCSSSQKSMMSDNAEGLFLISSAVLSGPTLVRKSDHKDASQLAKGLVGCCSGFLERLVMFLKSLTI